MLRFFMLAAPCAAALLLAGCGAFPQDAQLRDTNSALSSVRATVRPEALVRRADSRGGIQIGYDRFRAEGEQQLAAGESVDVLNGQPVVLGPDTLRNKARVGLAYLAYTHQLSFGPHFEVEPMLGLGHLSFDFEIQPVSSGAPRVVHQSDRQVFGGVTPRWRFNDTVALELRYAGSISKGPFSVLNADLGAVFRPMSQVGLRLGYSWRRAGGRIAGASEVVVRVRGPSAALQFDF